MFIVTSGVVAGAVGTFFLLLLLGLGALAVTAALDRTMGKERALFVYACVIAVFMFLMGPESPKPQTPKAKRLTELPTSVDPIRVDPFDHPKYDHAIERNVFEKYSDTRPLPPITLDAPPWVPLAFPLPPTIPGPAPAYRRALRGDLPSLTADDGSAIATIPDAAFVEYQPQPEDVFDWVMNAGKKFFIYIRELKEPDGKWVSRGSEGFDDLEWRLYRQGEGWQDLRVRGAVVGPAKTAEKRLTREEWVKAIRQNVSEKGASEQEGGWFLQRSVKNLYREALEASGLRLSLKNAGMGNLKAAATRMADVGRTGKEAKEGWRRVVVLLEHALDTPQGSAAAARADILERLLEAYDALRNEDAILRVLSEYARTSPSNHQPWSWLGGFMLEIGIPDSAEEYQKLALEKNRSDGAAKIGLGDALAHGGRHADAVDEYKSAGSTEGALLRLAEGYLRLGELDVAKREIERVLSSDPMNARATLVRGAVYYAMGDLDTARSAFERAATMDGATAERARACYNLGLTCFRLGQPTAAGQAFDACRKALELGSTPGPFGDETVSPALGEALIALGSGAMDRVPGAIERARREAPGNAYIEMLAGYMTARDGNTASASRAFEAAQRLARDYGELDGWLSATYLALAEQQVATGADADKFADTFAKALAFAERAAQRERSADKKSFRMHLRLALVQLRSQHLPLKERYERALKTVRDVVIGTMDRDQPAAWAIGAYCHYGLGGEDNVSQCIRDFQKVLEDIPEDAEGHPWWGWRIYASESLKAVKHWNVLEEKSVPFPDSSLSKDWSTEQSNGVHVKVIDGAVEVEGKSKVDSTMKELAVLLKNQQLFRKETLEEVSFLLRIPPKSGGMSSNNVTYGVQVLSGGRKAQEKTPGLGIFYDKGWMAFRVGGGQKKVFQDGLLHREGDGVVKQAWPEDEWIRVRIALLDAELGEMVIYVTTAEEGEQEVFRDTVAGFKNSRGKADLWFGGWSNQAEDFDVRIKGIRVVRKSK